MKRFTVILLCCLAILFTGCQRSNQNYEEGLASFENKDYVAAEASLKKAIDEGYNKDNISVVYSIVSEYNVAKDYYDEGEYNEAETHLEKIPSSYSEYGIAEDVDALNGLLKTYKDGMAKLDVKNYEGAEASFKTLLDDDPNKADINVIYTIISEYNLAKSYYDAAEYDAALTHMEKIPYSYTNYAISVDIEALNGQLKNIKDIDTSITKATNLLESGDYEEANDIILKIDTQYSTDKQAEKIKELQKQIKIKKKNYDQSVLNKINTLVETYAYGLCEAVNTDNFRPLNGTLYKGSSIYKEQVAYIQKMANLDIYEYCRGAEVSSVDWTSETTCVISTVETYEIYNYTSEDYSTQTFRYTYDVIETTDGQLFLTSIRNSN